MEGKEYDASFIIQQLLQCEEEKRSKLPTLREGEKKCISSLRLSMRPTPHSNEDKEYDAYSIVRRRGGSLWFCYLQSYDDRDVKGWLLYKNAFFWMVGYETIVIRRGGELL